MIRGKKAFGIAFFSFFALLMLLFGCVQQQEQGTIKVGALLPLSGNAATIGEFYRKGIELAVKEINAEGGINGKELEIVYEDSQNNAATAISGFKKLVQFDKVPVVFVAMSGITMPLIPIAEETKTVMITFATHPDATKNNQYVFRTQINAGMEAEKMAEYAYQKQGFRKIAVLFINDDLGKSASKVFEQQFKGEISAMESFEKNKTDFRAEVIKIKESEPKAIYIVGYGGSETGQVIKQLRELGVDQQLMSNFGVAYEPVKSIAGEALDGLIFTDLVFDASKEDEATKKFVKEFEEKYGSIDSITPDTPIAFDSVKVVAAALKSGATSAAEIKDFLYAVKGFEGVAGAIDFDEEGEVIRPLAIRRILNGKVSTIE